LAGGVFTQTFIRLFPRIDFFPVFLLTWLVNQLVNFSRETLLLPTNSAISPIGLFTPCSMIVSLLPSTLRTPPPPPSLSYPDKACRSSFFLSFPRKGRAAGRVSFQRWGGTTLLLFPHENGCLHPPGSFRVRGSVRGGSSSIRWPASYFWIDTGGALLSSRYLSQNGFRSPPTLVSLTLMLCPLGLAAPFPPVLILFIFSRAPPWRPLLLPLLADPPFGFLPSLMNRPFLRERRD